MENRMEQSQINISKVREIISEAAAILLVFGAGMSTDSGLPDYRSKGGWYSSYGPFQKIMPDYMNMLTLRALSIDPLIAWGFWGHMLTMFRGAVPHAGYALLKELSDRFGGKSFVLTSNVDGLAHKAGFPAERIHECHGSFHTLQCRLPCCRDAWPTDQFDISFDGKTLLGIKPLPACLNCGGLLRPNVYFFGDSDRTYVWETFQSSAERFTRWMKGVESERLLVVEVGCGDKSPGLRDRSTAKFGHPNCELIRINAEGRWSESEKDGLRLTGRAVDVLRSILS